MCGIFGYVGKSDNIGVALVDGLKRLEYRGYDSAGLVVAENKKFYCKKIRRIKDHSAIDDLRGKIKNKFPSDTVGIAHTRWATHGEPVEKNAHPHCGCRKEIYLVHNGIIENYLSLKKKLQKKGHKFSSDTDTEILVHLVEDYFAGNLENAVRQALREVEGTYGIAVVSLQDPDKVVLGRKGSPLGLGIADDYYVLASDASAIIPHTKEIIYLDDGEMAVITASSHRISSIEAKKEIHKKIQTLDWDIADAKRGGYDHFMLKEIFEQPKVVKNSSLGRLDVDKGLAVLGGIRDYADALQKVKRISIVACGTALHAGMVGKYMFEEYAGVAVETDYASEFRYRSPVLDAKCSIVLAISQSGETADTLEGIREAQRRGVKAFGIVNTVGSTIARETDAGVYNHAGPEIGVASTKAFTSQLVVFALWALFLGRQRDMSEAEGKKIAQALQELPKQIEEILKQDKVIKKIARKYAKYRDFLYLGRNNNFPIALEGALKLKEISYIHAEGYAAGEMKHGPLALVDKDFPSVCIAPRDHVRDKMISNIKEIQARKGKILAIATKGDKEMEELANDTIFVPKTHDMLTPILTNIPLQLFAYHAAVALGCDVDRPRNLAKSVTVE